jgi:hypothetical protein
VLCCRREIKRGGGWDVWRRIDSVQESCGSTDVEH